MSRLEQSSAAFGSHLRPVSPLRSAFAHESAGAPASQGATGGPGGPRTDSGDLSHSEKLDVDAGEALFYPDLHDFFPG
jgi:hypothetical protein